MSVGHWFSRMLDLFPPAAGVVTNPVIYPEEVGDVTITDEDIINLTEEKICTTEMEEKPKTAIKS